MLMNKNFIITCCRVAISILFIFSGILKLNDPVGFSLKIEIYFRGFSLDFGDIFLKLLPYSLPIAIGVCVAEVILGVALWIKFQTRLIIRVLLVLTGFFTLLALYTLWFRKVDSCGCLSDAIPLTPRQTFTKNIAILLTLHLLHKNSTLAKNNFSLFTNFILLLLVTIGSTCLGVYTSYTLPIVDYSKYRIGTCISDILYPNNSNPATNTELFIHKFSKDGFTIWNDKKEITNDILQGTKLLCIIQKTEKLNNKRLQQLTELIQHLPNNLQFIWLLPLHEDKTSLPTSIINPIAWSNENLLQNLIRADIGLVLIQNGTIINKWSINNLCNLQEYLNKIGLYKQL